MNDQKKHIVSIGEVMIEMSRGPDGRFSLASGGDTFNTAVYLARHGMSVAYATALGIPLESVSVKLEGALDLRGFFAVKDGVRAGFNDVRGTVALKSSAPAAELAKLKEVVDAHCPVLNILRAPVPVDLKLETQLAVHAA